MQERSCLHQQVNVKYSKSVPVSSTLAHTKKIPHCKKWLEKHKLTKQPENKVNLEWINFILYHCCFSAAGTHTKDHHQNIQQYSLPTGFPLVLSLVAADSAFYLWAYSPRSKRLPASPVQISHLQHRNIGFIILQLCLARPQFLVACWSDTKLWKNLWHDATVVYDFQSKDPGWKLSGDIPSKLS